MNVLQAEDLCSVPEFLRDVLGSGKPVKMDPLPVKLGS